MKTQMIAAGLSFLFSSMATAATVQPKTLVCENYDVVGTQVLSKNKGGDLLVASLEADKGDYHIQVNAWQPLPGSLAKAENVNIFVTNKKTGAVMISGNFIVTHQIRNNSQAYLQFFESDGGDSTIVSCELR